MTEIFKIILTSGLTIIGGVIIYVFGQIADKFFIKSIFEQKQVIGEVLDALIFYANVYGNPNIAGMADKYDEASKKFRQLSSMLAVKTSLIPYYNFFYKLKIVIKKENTEKAQTELIRLSNGVYGSPVPAVGNMGIQNAEVADKIKGYLFNN